MCVYAVKANSDSALFKKKNQYIYCHTYKVTLYGLRIECLCTYDSKVTLYGLFRNFAYEVEGNQIQYQARRL
jgi:hypothetical protein